MHDVVEIAATDFLPCRETHKKRTEQFVYKEWVTNKSFFQLKRNEVKAEWEACFYFTRLKKSNEITIFIFHFLVYIEISFPFTIVLTLNRHEIL